MLLEGDCATTLLLLLFIGVGGEGVEMEPYYGRRGKETICGIHRANQTLVLMLAMVATMACVLLWEASPFTGASVAQSPALKSCNILRHQASLASTTLVTGHRPLRRSSL